MGKFRPNIVRKGKPPKTEAQYEAEGRANLERMTILASNTRRGKPKVSLPTFSWEAAK